MISKKMFGKKAILIMGIIFALCLAIAFLTRDYASIDPLKEFTFDGTVYASHDEDGNTLLIEQAGARILKIGTDNTLMWKKESSSDIFESPVRIVSSNGHIFIQDTQIDEGIRLSGETIEELDANGKHLGTTAKYIYTEPTLQPHIFGLFPLEDNIAYLYKVEDEFRLIRPGVGEKNYPLENAFMLLRSGAYDEATDTVYYCTFDGKIFRYVDGAQDDLLFSGTHYDTKSIPNEISFSEGTLYVTDIGLRDILAIDTVTGEITRYEENIDFPAKEIAYYVNADHGLVATTSYSVKDYLGDYTYDYRTACDLSIAQKAMAIFFKFASAIGAAVVFYYLLLLARTILRGDNKYAKGIAGIIIGTILISILIICVLVPQFQASITESLYSRAQLASDVMAGQLPKDAFLRLREADDFMNEDYLAVKKVANNIFKSDSENMKDLYCCLYQMVDGVFVMSYSLKDSVGAIYPYDWELEGSNEELVLTTKQSIQYQSSSAEGGEYLFTYGPILDDEGNAIGIIEVGKDMQSYRSEISHMVFDAIINVLAVTVVLILTIIEVVYFVKGRNEYNDSELERGEGNVRNLPPEIMRITAFLVFFLTNLATSFLPVYAMNIAEESGTGLFPPEVMAAVPLSAEVITGAVFSLVGVPIIEKLGEKKAVFFSSILFTAGFALRVVPSIWMLILGNAVLGIGWGVILLAANMRITELPDEEKDLGFSQYNVAALNGVNCGVVFGGFLVNWADYRTVFIISAVLSLSMLIVTSRYFIREKNAGVEKEEDSAQGVANTIAFIFNPQVLTLFLMVVAPIMICSYFLNYMYPIIGADYGLSETYIGYSYLLNGLCVMGFGAALTGFFTKKNKKREGLVASLLLYAVAFLIVVKLRNVPSLLLALMLLGVSDSFGLPLQSGLYTDSKAVERFGLGNAFGVYNLVINVAQSIGPFVFSYVLLAGEAKGLTLIFIILSVLAVAFLVVGKLLDRREAKKI